MVETKRIEPVKAEQPKAEPAPAPEAKPAPLVTRVLVLPVQRDRVSVEYFGIPVESAEILINYHDLAKVRVRATEAALNDLASKAAAKLGR